MYSSMIDQLSRFENASLKSDLKNGYVGTSQIEEVGDVYMARIVLAGIDKSEIKLKADNDHLNVFRGDEEVYTIRLRNMIDVPSISSKLENGLLCITMPKKQVGKSVEIQIL